MKLYCNKISTAKPKSFEDFVKDFKSANQVKTASVKVAEQEEADSSGQLEVEPLHQEGESTTMPKAGPSAKKEGKDEKSAAATKEPDAEGESSGQPEAEGTEKLTNNVKFDPNDSSDEEKGIDAGSKTTVKVAGETCEKCSEPCSSCSCKGGCDCKACTASKETEVKEAGIKGNCSKCSKPNFLCKCDGEGSDDSDNSDDSKDTETKTEEKEEKEAKTVKFVKIANLDGKNKGFLREYWRQLFGDDYVNALIADK